MAATQTFPQAINLMNKQEDASSAKIELIPAPMPHILSKGDYQDFRAELYENGFAVIKGAIPLDRAEKYCEKAHDWLRSFGTDLDFDNPDTWVSENLPHANQIRTYADYCVNHEKFMWDARLEPGVVDAFAKVWETDELLVSFDSLNITFPNRKDIPRRKAWEHIDQSPMRRGLHCVQGIIALSPSGPDDGGLVVYPKSHKFNDEFFGSQSDKKSWLPFKDIYMLPQTELDWFTARGMGPHKVCAEPGDLILWDSRVIHYGSEPTEKSNQTRTAIYAAYTPASMATPEQLALKKQVFEKYGGTTHWPHSHIAVRNPHVMLPDGTRDPRDRDQPLEIPEFSDRLLKLAGAKSY
ncbi:hypothetical protein P175DRAFT_0541963 [Aspergillus ochraceoroseus IBT 24754]|uniref:Phytanoyl-CoA dioxygenase n=2 Tax=Aspergillus ochraceoroseus TaxID=138278 RepID=A0A2T5M160_9EURO|nr:uncharacterized protein P175DRAFT_0541963 [Aspergillus ochraceoroseus IBT 24754]KKK21922.1 hypothetical protein AOCH_000183 [Aspergillus ochraceoroseus]PTU22273.1 hypothetical protein P175DRAFT_0541963 [Aspergillus ochraceoroseus IBT 24754]